ncbi:glycoside hydrolase family 2 TIM barrel-domain containing protein [Akkermansia sp.]|uniref:glycoside hydrolase family 2 TIM barrel-domain containing protein n=2 Tax=Akkermansia sp. TaxID=1872421 RepID=UPI002670F4DA|nr:glycoside hydrolase family 2 TIM barrel-domain containing protein [uncultured Akkermansia sp.]MEE0763387.1 glycoside hydrolase family 2 TIM barrel-domain containing protein [Akkermansia sp.]
MNISPVFLAAAVLSGAMSAHADQKNAAEEAASSTGQYSVAGALRLPEQTTKRHVYGMNVGWKFFKGKNVPQGVTGADFDDSSWQSVNLPDGIELLPEEASGCSNYQGPVWYRKTFTAPADLKGRRNTLYFEGIMGKSEVWVNGEKAAEHLGGYLPVIVNLDKWLKPGQKNVIVVKADNSNDGSYPPGKPQESLDFAYFGGIYRDAYLISTGPVYITDPNEAGTVAGGGIFFRTQSLDPRTRKGKTAVKVQVANNTDKEQKVRVQALMTDPKGVDPVGETAPLVIPPHSTGEVDIPLVISNVRPWSPDNPNLYTLSVEVWKADGGTDAKNPAHLLDNRSMRVGIRTVEITEKGLVLNGSLFPEKLIGGNRHQDFARLGNAVPNNLQWQDAVKLRKAGMRVIRSAHYPQDPAFMDACDRLGLFVIVATPGWQFWGKGPFADRVYDDVRQMVRRDRNHPSVMMWEPILNETHYPKDFAKKVRDLVHEEYPYPGCYTACDAVAQGSEHYEVLYAHPSTGDKHWSIKERKNNKPYFTREFGDNVDTWSAHNSTSRVARHWGEVPMMVQALHYLKTSFPYTNYDTLNAAPAYHFGGCLWHPFDHQRGYHPDPFYGGILDAFRQPKTSYYAFMSQRPQKSQNELGSGPVVYIANECTPFSPEDVTVFSNCDSVRLSVNGGAPVEKKVGSYSSGLKRVPVVFPKAWDFMENKTLARAGKEGAVKLVAEGLIGGKVVTRHEVRPSRRAEKIRLRLDREEGVELSANGSDVFAVVAEVTDSRGTVKRLNDEEIVFSIEGPAELLTDSPDGTLVQPVKWGSAPALVRLGTQPGTVTVKASVKHPGSQKPVSGVLKFDTKASGLKMLFQEDAVGKSRKGGKAQPFSAGTASEREEALQLELEKVRHELNNLRNDKVSRQQSHFE